MGTVKRPTKYYVTPLGGVVEYARDHVILKDLRGQKERGRFAEAAFFASRLREQAAILEAYFQGKGAGGPANAYEARNAINRVLDALEFCLGARTARNEIKREAKTKASPKVRAKTVAR